MMADVASSSCSAPLSLKKYDVFISFRGEDTRSNFTSHLHGALSRKRIQTYIDYRLDKGDDIWPAITKAIEDSHIFLVVVSQSYASSKWCLNELTKILEYKEMGHITLPVFYRIDPSNFRKLTGSNKIAFAKHEKDFKTNKEMVEKWKAALIKIANLCGWYSQNYRTEDELIQIIVKTIMGKLKHNHQNFKKLVGIGKNYACIESSLRIESKEVQVMGIWGMGGIGKTTIAAVAFAKLSSKFEGSCFLANVKEESEKHGLNYLRNKLFSALLEEDNLYIGTPLLQTSFVLGGLRGKKVFIVLDDVNDPEQLNYLIGDANHLGPGSCVIVTSRDKDVLLSTRVQEIHEIIPLSFQESLQLFCMNAFNKSNPEIGYGELSERIVDYAKGNPLASKILGLHFCSRRSAEIWESELEKLKKYPNKKIQDILKLSYEGLDNIEKEIFLDVASFFRGQHISNVKEVLNACEFYAASGIDSLQKKALITISYENTIEMHDLIQEMGRGIIRQESFGNLGSQSRLWDSKEIYDVLKSNKGTDKVEGIMLDLSQIGSYVHLRPDTFRKMINLRYLIFYKGTIGCHSVDVCHSTSLESLPNNLRCLEWYGYPLSSLPSVFCPENLVQISMQCGHVEKLWEGVQDLVNLKKIDLRGSKHLIELPDFSHALKLERVFLGGCASLRHVHPSILSLHNLVVLFLNDCKSLRSLESVVYLRSLSQLSLECCSSLKKFSVTSENMEYLDLDGTAIVELPSSIGCLNKLNVLDIRNCFHLKNLSNELCGLTSLHTLNVSSCRQVDTSNLGLIFDRLRSLSYLDMRNCFKLYQIPDNICLLSQLTTLGLSGSNVEALPANIIHLSQLTYLNLWNCRRLRFIPELPPSVRSLVAGNCISLETVCTNSLAASIVYKFSLENCVKLDEHSMNTMLNRMKEGIVSEIVYPGTKIPNCFSYQTTQPALIIESCLTADLCGAIFCVILSQCLLNEEHSSEFKIRSKYCLADGRGDRYTRWMKEYSYTYIDPKGTASGILDHVFIWYDDLYLSESDYRNVSFEFFVQSDETVRVSINGCGVQPIYNKDLKASGIRVGSFPTASADNRNEKELEREVYTSFSSSATLSPKKYDVFISFGVGENESNFACRLHAALSHRKIETYIDDGFQKGYENSPTVIEAIEKSRVLVVIFSENYASSKWCLNEYTKIVECKEKGQIVIPVFYEVDPFNDKDQTAGFYLYRKAVERNEQYLKKNKETVQKRRDDLRNPTELSAWKCRHYSEESKIIQTIAEDIIEKLNNTKSGELPDCYRPSNGLEASFNSFIESGHVAEEAIAVPIQGCATSWRNFFKCFKWLNCFNEPAWKVRVEKSLLVQAINPLKNNLRSSAIAAREKNRILGNRAHFFAGTDY